MWKYLTEKYAIAPSRRAIRASMGCFLSASLPPACIAVRSAQPGPRISTSAASLLPPPRRRKPDFVPACVAGLKTAPDLASWRGISNTVSRALALIADGALDGDDANVAKLSDRLGVGERQLRRLFLKHLGASPVAVAQTRRVLFAKQLIHASLSSANNPKPRGSQKPTSGPLGFPSFNFRIPFIRQESLASTNETSALRAKPGSGRGIWLHSQC